MKMFTPLCPHLSTGQRWFAASNSQCCSPSDPQATSGTIEHMNDEHPYPDEYEPGANVTMFHLPATWQDMEYLGLNPLTGEPLDQQMAEA